MKIKFDTKYAAGKYSFPSDSISQIKKDTPDYFRDCVNAIVSKYVSNKTSIPYDIGTNEDSIQVLRSYLYGNNSNDKYKNLLAGFKDKKTGTRKTTMNISWRVPQILPEKMDVVKGYIMKLAYDITTQAIDMQAQLDKDMIVANMKLMIDDNIKSFVQSANEQAGREVIAQDSSQQIPFQNDKQVEMFAKIGGIILEQEASIKILLDQTILESDSAGIREKMVEDVLALGICGKKIYNDAGSDIAKEAYVDIERAVIPWSKYNDFRDITYAAEIPSMSIAQLRLESGLPEKQIIEIARIYSDGMQDFYHQVSKGYTNSGFGMNMIDSIMVDVVDARWIGTTKDTISKLKRPKEGNLTLKKVTEDYEPGRTSKKQGVEVESHTRQCVYKAKLILGTDYVFDYGLDFNQTYKKDHTGRAVSLLPYRFGKTGSSSLVSRCIGFVDDLALATFKKRNALKKLPPPPGVYIEQSAFQNVEIGGNKMNPLQCMKLFQDEGYMIGNTQNLFGNNTTGRSPITEIPTGIITQLTLFNNEIEFNINQIERVTGINDIFSGSTPNSEQGLGVSQIAVNATMNAIYPIVRTLETVDEQALRVAAKKWQVAATHMDTPGRKPMPHDRALRYLKAGKGISYNDFMIKLGLGPTDQEKAMLMQDIKDLQNIRRQSGSGGIRPSDYLMLFEMIQAGNIKQARLMLAQVEEYIMQLDADKERQNQEYNIQAQMQSSQQAAENEIGIKTTEAELQANREAQNIQLKLQGEMMLLERKAQHERRNIALENVYGRSKEVA